jgi:hypothetical protein
MNPPGTYYFIRVSDNNGNILMSDRWVLNGATVDVGTIISATITGTTQTLGSNGVVVSTASTNQTVTQSSGTKLNVNYLGATTTFTMPDTGYCNSAGCVFQGPAAFVNGISMVDGSNSVIFVGNGSLYNRTFTGTNAACSGVTDGWTAIRSDTREIQVCIGGNLYAATLVAK